MKFKALGKLKLKRFKLGKSVTKCKKFKVSKGDLKKLKSKMNGKKAPKKKEKRMNTVVEVPKFKMKKKFSRNKELKKEFERQVKGQEKGLNKLTIKEYLENRKAYKDRLENEKKLGKKNPSGRDPKGSAQQKRIREEAYENKFNEYVDKGVNPEEAEKKANAWLKTQAALHDPDQIAGGNPANVTGMGNKRVNSSLGSQWKTRADAVEDQVQKYIKDNNLSEKDLGKTYLNIKLSCGGN